MTHVPIETDLEPPDLTRWGAALVTEPRYSLCKTCGLLFARARQSVSNAEIYYAAFQELEEREYAVYPPPQLFLDSQRDFAERLGSVMDAADVFAGCKTILNIRSECGMHLERARRVHGITDLYALDHFASNIRYMRDDLDIAHAAYLHPIAMRVPFAPATYDVVLCNHLLTHSLDPSYLLKQLRHLVSPSGRVVFYNEYDHRRYLKKWPLRGMNNFHKQLLTPSSLKTLCHLHGFEARMLTTIQQATKWGALGNSMVALATPMTPLTATANGEYQDRIWHIRASRLRHAVKSLVGWSRTNR